MLWTREVWVGYQTWPKLRLFFTPPLVSRRSLFRFVLSAERLEQANAHMAIVISLKENI